jgi:hypothetical protein
MDDAEQFDCKKYLEQKWNEDWFEFMASKNHTPDWCRCDNPNVTLELIKTYPKYQWNWKELSRNPNITIPYILANNRFPKFMWDFQYVSENPNLQLTDVIQNIGKNWNWEKLSRHKNITLDMILAHPELPWERNAMCQNPNITIEMMLQHPEKKWEWCWVINNPNITFSDMLNIEKLVPHFQPRLSTIIHNVKISRMDIYNHPEIEWMDKYKWGLEHNVNVDCGIVRDLIQLALPKSEKEKSTTFSAISFNKNVRWYMIAENVNEHWNWRGIAGNPFTEEKQHYMEKNADVLLKFILDGMQENAITAQNHENATTVDDVFANKKIMNCVKRFLVWDWDGIDK